MNYFSRIYNFYQNLKILLKRNNKFMFLLFFLNLLYPFIEIFSLSLLLPIFEIFLGTENISVYSRNILKFFEFFKIEKNINILLLCFIFLILIKNLTQILYIQLNNYFLENLRTYWSNTILEKLIYKDYLSFKEVDNAKYYNNIFLETRKCQSSIKSLLTIISELFIFFFIVSILFFISFQLTIFIFICYTILGLIAMKPIINFSKNSSKKNISLDNFFSKTIQNILQGIKQIKFFKSEELIFSNFKKKSKEYAIILSNFRSLTQFIGNFLEIYSLFLISLIFIYFLYIKKLEFAVFIPELVIFLIISSKLSRSFNSLYSNSVVLLGTYFNINTISQLISAPAFSENKLRNITLKNFKDSIQIKNIFFDFNNKKIFSNYNLEIKKKDKVLVIGGSGTGKSTLIDLLLSFYNPKKGEILIDGNDIKDIDPYCLNKLIGYVPQNLFFSRDNIRNNLILNRKGFSDDEIWKCLKIAEADSFVEKNQEQLEYVLTEGVTNLSGGQIQRLGIARSLLNNPQILIFDESTNAIDVQLEKKIFNNIFLYYPDITLIMISHRSDYLWANKIINLDLEKKFNDL
jgi:ABC-type bacteriocin/lantibiotic exporter with double-glycine peptidase domain